MSELRVGTRASDLALAQTRWVCARLREIDAGIVLREVPIRTHGDQHPDAPIDELWPEGGFVGAIERALLDGQIDFAVHSLKDLPSQMTEGLTIAAVPEREVVHDVVVLREPVVLSSLPRGFRIGTSSPRRAAQWRRFAGVEVVPIRGNVPTRMMRMERDGLDGVILAAAGLRRLRIDPPHIIDLPVADFLPAPGQGALALQTRTGDDVASLISQLDHAPSRLRVEAERALLATVGPGCHTPVAALATLEVKEGESDESTPKSLRLRGQLFSDAGGSIMVEDVANAEVDPLSATRGDFDAIRKLGTSLGLELKRRLDNEAE